MNETGSLLPPGETGSQQVRLAPLGIYSLTYPKLPLLLVDFRDKLHVRRHEMTQRSINEITAGVIGISHFTNWYYYVAADFYDFITARHGGAMDRAERLDSYSQFRVQLALDQQLDPKLRAEMQRRVDSLAINPLEATPDREMQLAAVRYAGLQDEAGSAGKLATHLEQERRAELASFGESKKARVFESLLHDASLGLYTHRAKTNPANLSKLDCYRRVQYNLAFLDELTEAGTEPEIAYDANRIRDSVAELSSLMPQISMHSVRAHAAETFQRLARLSHDQAVQGDCSLALAALDRDMQFPAKGPVGIAASTRSGDRSSRAADSLK